MRRRGSARIAIVGIVSIVSCTALAGCGTVGNCAAEITVGAQVRVTVDAWIGEHPGTDVRVCVGDACDAGFHTIVVTGEPPSTPFTRKSTLEVEADVIQGETTLRSVSATAALSPDQCGQWGAHLTLAGDGVLHE